jgi:serine/threonine protein kinase
MQIDHECMRGDVIGGAYVIGDLVGVGGMGVVYSAVQRSLGSNVVVKLPRPDLEIEPIVRHRFRTEALAGARISHRNVVRVLDYGEDRGRPFLVMEQVLGPRLGALDCELTLANALDVIRQLLEGVLELHAAGVVHGDIKCDNVLVETSREGVVRPRLIDFGLARLIGETVWIAEGFVAGTPEYLAPELVLGALPTPASDLYAIGIMLYELVTGETPFHGTTIPETMHSQLVDRVTPIAELRPGSPALLDDVVAQAVAKMPSARFADATAFLAALAAVDPLGASAAASFSTEAITLPMPTRMPMGSNQGGSPPVVLARRAAALAVEERDVTGFLVAHLELARALIGDHDLATAIGELEAATRIAYTLGPTAREAPLWRLQLMLAGLYDWRGNRARARKVALAARAQALHVRSAVGQTRAEELLARLSPGRASSA